MAKASFAEFFCEPDGDSLIDWLVSRLDCGWVALT